MKLNGENIYLKYLDVNDADAVLKLELANKDFFQKYSPSREDDFFTLEGQRKRIEKNREQMDQDQNYAFGIFLNEDNRLIGAVHLSEVVRGPLQSAWLGYSLDKSQNGKGYMTEAVRLIVNYAFDELNLHRIEAGVMPHNHGSIKVLEKVGFEKEGIARKNVKINGVWEDHWTLSIINEESNC